MSISFLGNNTSYISVPSNDGLNFGTQDFTVEWFHYQTDTNTIPRIYQRGVTPAAGFSGFIIAAISSAGYYYVTNNSVYRVNPLTSDSYRNKWIHFAICRLAGTTTVYMNGVRKFAMYPDVFNYTTTEDLFIGNDSTLASNRAFGGYLYYFHYIKGVAKYTSNFTVSTAMVSAIPETVLLLTANGASGSLGHTITNNAGTFDIIPTLEPVLAPALPVNKQLTFSDNSRVYYKKSSLAPGGIGGVRNHRRKARKT
jgi:hypothetical protein